MALRSCDPLGLPRRSQRRHLRQGRCQMQSLPSNPLPQILLLRISLALAPPPLLACDSENSFWGKLSNDGGYVRLSPLNTGSLCSSSVGGQKTHPTAHPISESTLQHGD